MISNRVHGILSLLLITSAVATGWVAVAAAGLWIAVAYTLVIAMATPVVLYAYCAKCTCRHTGCRHVIPGRLTAFLPWREPAPYHFADYAATAVALLLLLGLPLPWLFGYKGLLWLYILFLSAGMTEILFLVCRGCGNRNCPVRRSHL